MTISKVLAAADHLASAVNAVRDDARQGLATGSAKKLVERCRADLDAALDSLTEGERDSHVIDGGGEVRELAEAGDSAGIARMIYLHELETAPAHEIPSLLTQALEAQLPVTTIMSGTGLSRALVEVHALDVEPLPVELRAVVDADIVATVLERQLAQARERRSQAAHAAADAGFSWYRISQTVGRSQSTLQRW